MQGDHSPVSWGTSQQLTNRVLATLERFLHTEAVSGILLILAAVVALVWTNSALVAAYEALWHTPITLGIGALTATPSLHFLVNEGLMTIFFLVAGLEIRRELHEGALSNLRLASLPMSAALAECSCPQRYISGSAPAPKRVAGGPYLLQRISLSLSVCWRCWGRASLVA
jgi:Na+:H+ antiporter, NhaA family